MRREDLTRALERMLDGAMGTPEIVELLERLEADGVGADEIAAGRAVMRAHMRRVDIPKGAIDIVGTGGTGLKTLSISTATAIVVAACGVPVAKHGNRGASSPTGTADTLAELGVDIGMSPNRASAAVSKVGLGFLYAPTYHPALRHVGEARREIGKRTLFNRLGPLCNPGGVQHMLLGVAVEADLDPIAEALAEDAEMTAWVVRGRDGLDEITLTDTTDVRVVEGGKVVPGEVDVEAMGLERRGLADLRGGVPAENAAALRGLLDGERGAYRDVVRLNAAAALRVVGRAIGWADGMDAASEALDSGAAAAKLAELAAFSRG